jgi:hypothetical protein
MLKMESERWERAVLRQMKKVLGLENNPAISRFSSLPASNDVIDARRFPPSKVRMNTIIAVLPKKPPLNTLSCIQRIPTLRQTRHLPNPTPTQLPTRSFFATFHPQNRQTQSTSTEPSSTENEPHNSGPPPPESPELSAQKKQSLAERDADHLAKMREAIGGADHCNVEMEDGVPDRGMKRNVRENMFRIM